MDQCNLLELLKSIEEVARCPICLEQVCPPVSLCANGHGTCQQCRASHSECSTCKGPFLAVQPRILEQILQLLPKPCKYYDDGCKTVLVNDYEHELFCMFRPIKCMLGENSQCDFYDTVRNWLQHLRPAHSTFRGEYNVNEPVTLYYNNFQTEFTTSRCYFHSVNSNLFLLFARKIDGNFIQTVRHFPYQKKPIHIYYFLLSIADKNGAEIFKYRLKAEVILKEEYFENSVYCMSVPIIELEGLLNEDGNLEVTLEVTQKEI